MNYKGIKWKTKVFTKKYLYNYIYKNYGFRPKGFYNDVDEYVSKHSEQGKIYYEIYPETISEINIPDNLIKASSSYLDYHLKAKESAKYILKIKNGRILSDLLWTIAVFDEKDKLIGDVSMDLLLDESQTISESRIFKRKYFQNLKYFKGTVFHIIAGGGSYDNYFHWLIDSISKIHLLKESGLFDQVDWFYVPSIEYDYQRDSLKALGVKEEQIIDGKKYPHIKADTLLAPSYARGRNRHIHQWIIDFLKKEFPPKGIPENTARRYFISRKDANTRKIVNEDEVSKLLAQYNIETVVLSKLSFQEKIDLFAYADLIISFSGAGSTNYLFCKEKTKVLELFGDQFVDFRFYYDIAMKENLDFYYFIGENVKKSNSDASGQFNDLLIDVEALKDKIENELEMSKANEPELVV
ncbi:DUF563 domain-containing protein [Maribellus comscasis]|uniref:DUF563 domain-containing protein n=1 Tax=Maribellus comscasis TaxID=2681766 RepID=A0A6I6JRR2_9BACT|nr:glycosyltransferase family 61 protein [Maribellus comscasis]QGY43919.1 DUF563 domain-containing protein [Maribellus comscasis]